jgi:hypothetical protein
MTRRAVLFFAAIALAAGIARGEPLSIKGLTFEGYERRPEKIRGMLDQAAGLVRKKLPYRYGVADPGRGFDCSGFVFHVLLKMGAPHVPRQAEAFHQWLEDKNALVEFDDDPELEKIEPGDLLFWSGTYDIDRDITHVMIYLGNDQETGKRWMIGASGKRLGIGVFAFDPARGDGAGKNFVGYGKTSAFFPENR